MTIRQPRTGSVWTIFRRRHLCCKPTLRAVLLGAPLWAMAMAGSAAFGLHWRLESMTSHWASLIIIYGAGGALAWPPALWLMRLIAPGRSAKARFTAAFLSLATGTIGATSLLYALVYYSFFAQWHGAFLSSLWARQLIITFVAALYQFAVLGLGIYLPVGLLVLTVVSIWLARDMR